MAAKVISEIKSRHWSKILKIRKAILALIDDSPRQTNTEWLLCASLMSLTSSEPVDSRPMLSQWECTISCENLVIRFMQAEGAKINSVEFSQAGKQRGSDD